MNTKIFPTQRFAEQQYNPQMMDFMTYKNSITEPVPQNDPSDLQYELETVYLFVSSTMRDRKQYLDPANFRVELSETFRDIVSIELQGGVLPNGGGIAGDGYVLLDIPELNHIQGANGEKYFGILTLQPHPNAGFLNLDRGCLMGVPAVFKPVKGRLSSFTISLRHPDGSLVSFGNEDPLQPANFAHQTQFTFIIRKRVRRRAGIDRDYRALGNFVNHPVVI